MKHYLNEDYGSRSEPGGNDMQGTRLWPVRAFPWGSKNIELCEFEHVLLSAPATFLK